MQVFRGPVTKPLSDPAHELVAEVSPQTSATFHGNSVVIVANVTKEPSERQAVVHLQLDAEDLLALHRRLLTGLTARVNELAELKALAADVSQNLYALWDPIDSYLQSSESDFDDEKDRLHSAVSHLETIRDSIGELAHRLDPWRP